MNEVASLPQRPRPTIYTWSRRGRVYRMLTADLRSRGIRYDVVVLRGSAKALSHIRRLGHSPFRVVLEIQDMHWSGYQPAKHAQLASILEVWRPDRHADYWFTDPEGARR